MLTVWGSVSDDSFNVPGVVGIDDFSGDDFLGYETVCLLGRCIKGDGGSTISRRETVVVGSGNLARGMTSALTRHLFKFKPIQTSLVANALGLGRDEAVAMTYMVVVRRVEVFMMASRLDEKSDVTVCQSSVP